MTNNEKNILTILTQMYYYGLKDENMTNNNNVRKLSFTIPKINNIYPEDGSIAEGFDIQDISDFKMMISKCINDILKFQVNEVLVEKGVENENEILNVLNNIKEFNNDKFELHCSYRDEEWNKKDGLDAIENFLNSFINN